MPTIHSAVFQQPVDRTEHLNKERYPHTTATNKTPAINNQSAQLTISRLPGFLWTLKDFIKNNNAFHKVHNKMTMQEF
jgi:hypothetical protein